MANEEPGAVTGSAAVQQQQFLKSIPLQIRLQEIRRVIGEPDGLKCLDFGNDNGAFSLHLRRSGGRWQTIVRDGAVAEGAGELLGEAVTVYHGGDVEIADKTFDLVVVGSGLEAAPDGRAFIEMCHRILKPDGRILVCVPRVKPGSLLNPLRRYLVRRRGGAAAGEVPARGYTEGQLFRTLKDGFDVHLMRSYSRFFVELADTLGGDPHSRGAAGPGDEHLMRRLSIWYVPAWIGYQLDALLFLTRGHRLIALAQRRPWLPRKTPVLTDGRSISEAVLQSAPP